MPKAITSKDSGIKKFIKENKSLAFMIPLLGILLIVLVIIYSSGGKPKEVAAVSPSATPSQSAASTPVPDTNQPQVEVLPQTERTNDDQQQVAENDGQDATPVQDPFKSPMKLTGVLIYSDESATAIIEYGGVSYVTKLDENVGDTTWKILSITDKNAILESNGKDVTLELNKEQSMDQGGNN